MLLNGLLQISEIVEGYFEKQGENRKKTKQNKTKEQLSAVHFASTRYLPFKVNCVVYE